MSSSTSSHIRERRQRTRRRSGRQALTVTVVMAVVAVCALGITAAIELSRQTPKIEEFGRVGKEFFPDFVDPTKASALKVEVYDEQRLKKSVFEVKQQDNGRWVIPSHYNYPVDAQQRLGRTASAVIGLTRGAMVTRWESDHGRYGVIDPETAVPTDEGIGRRITLAGKEDEVLLDLIVGKRVEPQPGMPTSETTANDYYARRADEDEVYITRLDIDLSTRFSDWINTDLLEITPEDVIGLTVNDYEIDEERARLKVADLSHLVRSAEGGTWLLEELDDPSAQVNQARVMELVNTLTNLSVIGVRPKLPGLRSDLTIDPRYVRQQQDLERLSRDLLLSGLRLVPDPESDGPKLISLEGELTVGTASGIEYTLYFGRAFAGEESEIEIGTSADGDSTTTDDSSDGSSTGESTSETTDPTDEAAPRQRGRYVFVRARLNPTLLGPEPTEPTEPPRPPELDDPTLVPEETVPDDGGEPVSRVARLQAIAEQYDLARRTYLLEQQAYQQYQSQLAESESRMAEIDRRFGGWYYVIDGEDFESLALDRASLLEARVAGPNDPIEEPPLPPGFPAFDDSEFPTLPPRLPPPTPRGPGAAGGQPGLPPSLPAPSGR